MFFINIKNETNSEAKSSHLQQLKCVPNANVERTRAQEDDHNFFAFRKMPVKTKTAPSFAKSQKPMFKNSPNCEEEMTQTTTKNLKNEQQQDEVEDSNDEKKTAKPKKKGTRSYSDTLRNTLVKVTGSFKRYWVPQGEDEKTGKHLAIVAKIVRAPKNQVKAHLATK